ncbi:MAG: RNA 2',3'-cyclic phosphodiesterase [Acidimicrobiia bacterium]|nr:RNA 2',3'-cyclic phosphodiesterase [Acidimicrobiia bacterium]
MARAFVAVVPPGEVLDAVEAAMVRARPHVPGARWSTREKWHVTLQFLGDYADLDAAAAALEQVGLVAGGLGSEGVRFGGVRFGGAGAFARSERATVLWLGFAAGAGLLEALAATVGEAFSPLGLSPDGRPFVPHLTLARMRAPRDVRRAISAVGRGPVGPEWIPDAVALMESTLRREGPRYRVHAEIPLG